MSKLFKQVMELKRKKQKAVEPYDMWADASGGDTTKSGRKLHPSLKRTKKMPVPHPGQSYNPDPEDHRRLLRKVVEKEYALKKKETSIKRAFETIKVNPKELHEHEKQELVSGIKHLIKNDDTQTNNDSEDGSSTDSAYSDYDEKDFEAILRDKKVKEQRKTKRQRLAQLRDKLQRKAAKLRKLKNIRLSKIDAVKKISKELDKKEKEAAAKQRKRHKQIKNERLGSKFEQSDPIYCLSSELPKNLREVSCPMNAIVREQLESFQSRLMVEPTSLQLKKRSKYKKKQYERKTAEEQDG